MKKDIKSYLYLVAICLLCAQGNALGETMYVTDRLKLSLRKTPDTGEPYVALLPSDTKVEVLETQGNWAHVNLEDGRTGWVIKSYLVQDVPKSLIIEQLKAQLEEGKTLPERLQKENASLRKEVDTLRNQIIQHQTRLEVITKENTLKRLKEIYVAGIVALIAGLIVGYLLRSLIKRPKRIGY